MEDLEFLFENFGNEITDEEKKVLIEIEEKEKGTLSKKLENLLIKLEEKGIKCNQIFDKNLVKEICSEEADGFFCMKDNGKIEDMCAKGSSAFYMCLWDYLNKRFGKYDTETAINFIENISKKY